MQITKRLQQNIVYILFSMKNSSQRFVIIDTGSKRYVMLNIEYLKKKDQLALKMICTNVVV